MYLQELPLVLFTLLAQWAVGIVLVGQCMLSKDASRGVRGPVRKQSLAALILFGAAAVISLGHTGTPLHGPLTLSNVAESPLSREIAMVAVTGLALLWLAFLRLKAEASAQEGLAAALVVAAGLVLIFVMSGVYNRPTLPGWNNAGVFPSFLGSALLLGGLWHGLVLSLQKEGGALSTGVWGGFAPAHMPALWAVIGLVLAAAALPLALSGVPAAVNASSLITSAADLACRHAVHAALSGAGVLLLVAATLKGSREGGLAAMLTLPAFLLVCAGELAGRFAFYFSYSRFGL